MYHCIIGGEYHEHQPKNRPYHLRQPPSCPPNGGTESRWLCPGQAVLGCCLSPVGYQTPDYLLVDGIHPELADPGFVRQYLGVSLTRKGAAFLHALQTLAAAKGVDLSFSLVYQGREEPLAELSPSTSTCCCTSASGPLCRPGAGLLPPCRGLRPPFPPFPLFTPFSVPLSGKPTLARSPRWVSCPVCRGGLRPCPDARPGRGDGRSPLAGHADRLAIAFHPPVLPVNSQAMAYAVTGQGPGFSPAAPDGKGALAFPDGPAILQSFFFLSFIFPRSFRYFLSFPLDFAADLRYYFNTKECILLRKPFSDTPAAGTGHPLFCLDILPFHPLPLSLPRVNHAPRPIGPGGAVFSVSKRDHQPGQEPNGGFSISMFSAAGGPPLIPESGSPRPRRFRCTGCGLG